MQDSWVGVTGHGFGRYWFESKFEFVSVQVSEYEGMSRVSEIDKISQVQQ